MPGSIQPQAIQFEDIQTVKYIHLKNNSYEISLQMRDLTTVNATKPVYVKRVDGKHFYLKISNPGNHQRGISFVETWVASIVRAVLAPHGVIVPSYEVIELTLLTTAGNLEKIPACLIEALNFRSFGECGTDVTLDPKKVDLSRLTPENQRVRNRQIEIIKSKAFLHYQVVMYWIGNNDPHQENFGTLREDHHLRSDDLRNAAGERVLAAIDFDMAPMKYLVEMGLFGPDNSDFAELSEGYHDNEGGRFTPLTSEELANFPFFSRDRQTPDLWISTWTTGGRELLKTLLTEPEFIQYNIDKKRAFAYLASLQISYFETVIQLPTHLTGTYPELNRLFSGLIDYFENTSQHFLDGERTHGTPQEASLDHNLSFFHPNTEPSPFFPHQGSSSSRERDIDTPLVPKGVDNASERASTSFSAETSPDSHVEQLKFQLPFNAKVPHRPTATKRESVGATPSPAIQ